MAPTGRRYTGGDPSKDMANTTEENFNNEFNNLNPAQKEAATTIEGNLLINAVAGSGKTKTLACRTAYMIKSGIAPQSILMFTFTNNAAKVMKERVLFMTEEGLKVTMKTCHSFCAGQLRYFGERIGLHRNFTIITQSDARDCIKMLMNTPDVLPPLVAGDNQFPKASDIANYISESMNKVIPLQLVLMEHSTTMAKQFGEQICAVADAYEKYKRDTNVCDYDDLLVLYHKLLSENPDILKLTSDTFRYIMVDEYQDTNKIQEMILFLLKDAGSGIAVVGDHAQSLYGFRGADMRNIIDFPTKVPDCKVVNLTTNYRSSQEILDVGNFILSNSGVGEQLQMRGTFTTGQVPRIVRENDSYMSSIYVVDKVKELHGKGKPWSDIAILSRNAASAKIIEMMFVRDGVPYVKYGGMKFLERAHIRDILAYIRVMVNSRDEIAWFRVLSAIAGIGAVTARNISADCRAAGAEGMKKPAYIGKKYTPSLYTLHDVICMDKTDPSAVLEDVIAYYEDMQRAAIKANMGKKPDKAREIQFVEDMTVNTEDNQDADGAVVISTIHSAKGLEWDTVFILDCVEGVFPRLRDEDIGTEKDEEELRCMYVAATRPKKELYFISPLYQKTSNYGGMPMRATPSHYLPYNDFSLMKRL